MNKKCYLAPMDGYTDDAFREVVHFINPQAVVFTEFFSADGLVANKKLASEKLSQIKRQSPVVVQLFGKNPANFALAAKIVTDYGADQIDINMGCPAKKVVGSGHGASLIKIPQLARDIAEATVRATKLPVSIKTRLGRSDDSTLYDFCYKFAELGIKSLTVHGRTYQQWFSGVADWEPIYRLKEQIPTMEIIGNGDVLHYQDGMEKVNNLDGFMIGRKAIGDPWVFDSIGWRSRSFLEKKEIILKHAELLLKYKGEKRGMLEFRKLLIGYSKGDLQAKKIREKAIRVSCLEDVLVIFKSF